LEPPPLGQAQHLPQRSPRSADASTKSSVPPADGQQKSAALITPAGNTEAINLHLAEISQIVAPRP
jgi:hypothetical protein